MMLHMNKTRPHIKTTWRPNPFVEKPVKTKPAKPSKKALHDAVMKELVELAKERSTITVRFLFTHMSKTHPDMGYTERVVRWYLRKCLPDAEQRLATRDEIHESYGKTHGGVVVAWIIAPLRG